MITFKMGEDRVRVNDLAKEITTCIWLFGFGFGVLVGGIKFEGEKGNKIKQNKIKTKQKTQ